MVPLSSFHTQLAGFRITLLEPDEERFVEIYRTVGRAMEEYIWRREGRGARRQGGGPAAVRGAARRTAERRAGLAPPNRLQLSVLHPSGSPQERDTQTGIP